MFGTNDFWIFGVISSGLESKRPISVLERFWKNVLKIYEAYNEKLMSWPVCSKSNGLYEFTDFLETMKSVKYLEEFRNYEIS